MTLEDWLNGASSLVPRSEARYLLEHATQLSREGLHSALSKGEAIAPDTAKIADALLRRRADGEPMAYVVGKKEFYGREFAVNESVLIPRPETEGLVELALGVVRPGCRCIDVGTGSGCVAVTLALECPASRWLATDVSSSALQVAKSNADHLGAKVSFAQADLLEAFRPGFADLIVSNPPYVAFEDPRLEESVAKWEPAAALFAGPTGAEAFIRLIGGAKRALRPGGALAFEFGLGQADEVRGLLSEWDFEIRSDLAGIERCALARAPG